MAQQKTKNMKPFNQKNFSWGKHLLSLVFHGLEINRDSDHVAILTKKQQFPRGKIWPN